MREISDAELATRNNNRGALGGFTDAAKELAENLPPQPKARALAALSRYTESSLADRISTTVILAATDPLIDQDDKDIRQADIADFVSAKALADFVEAGIKTVGDLLDRFPRNYVDRREIKPISHMRLGEIVTVIGKVHSAKPRRVRSGRTLLTVTLKDASGYLDCLWWNQGWRAKQLPVGALVAVSGTAQRRSSRLQMTNPAYDVLDATTEVSNTGQIVGIYPASQNLSTHRIRDAVVKVLAHRHTLFEPTPASIRVSRGLIPADLAYRFMHLPQTTEEVAQGRHKFVFEEFFVLQVALAARKRATELAANGMSHTDIQLAEKFVTVLPFTPTQAQTKAFDVIAKSMASSIPMHSLLQGEVGSGKTLVAAYAALIAHASGSQVAFMAPTEVLAIQHARKLRELLDPIGVEVGLITSSTNKSVRSNLTMRLSSGDSTIVCGTHALLSEDVEFVKLGLAVIDEQHRFGLEQRRALRQKGKDPDVLIMTATPIPRTLALTAYGDLDVVVLDEMPKGRQPTTTSITSTEQQRDAVYAKIREEVARGNRAFVVCALVDESDKLELRAAVAESERLRNDVFQNLEVGLMHGQMRPQEKDAVMQQFRRGEISVLIATTVVEVGVDVPEATVMLIEDAERFGISQLHQLRGRVGRGPDPAFCFLATAQPNPDALVRLQAVASTNDGFELAEQDLRLRGEGTMFATRQSGMTDLKVASLIGDYPVLVDARKIAFDLVAADPTLSSPTHEILRNEVIRRFGESVEWLFVG